ncbi:MAG: YfhD family protein [Paenibacillaceae bacterium]
MNDQRDQNQAQNQDRHGNKELPITHNKDVEFSQEVADEDDFEALHRAELAEQRNREEE